MSVDLLALGAEMTPEQERGYILNTVGPGRYIIVVPKALRDEIMEKHQFKDEDVPGLIVPRFGEIGIFHSVVILQSPLPKHIPPHMQPRPRPYPQRLKGRYAR